MKRKAPLIAIITSLTLILILGNCVGFFPSSGLSGRKNEIRAEKKIDLNELITYYYKKPQPELVFDAMKYFLVTNYSYLNEYFNNDVVYFFGRVARTVPHLVDDYLGLMDIALHEQRIFLMRVLRYCGNEKVQKFLQAKASDKDYTRENKAINYILENGFLNDYNPAQPGAVTDSLDIDIIMMEFNITGDMKAIEKMIEVMGYEDKTRAAVTAFLAGSADPLAKTTLINNFKQKFDIQIDPESRTILSRKDLDIALLVYFKKASTGSKSYDFINSIMSVSEEDFDYILLKGYTYWNLRLYADLHETIIDYLKKNLDRQGKKIQICLDEIFALYAELDGKSEESLDYQRKLLELEPYDSFALYKLVSLSLLEGKLTEAAGYLEKLKQYNPELGLQLENRLALINMLNAEDSLEYEEYGRDFLDKKELIDAIKGAKKQAHNYQTYMQVNTIKKNEILEQIGIHGTVNTPETYAVEEGIKTKDKGLIIFQWFTQGENQFHYYPRVYWDSSNNTKDIRYKMYINGLLDLKGWDDMFTDTDIRNFTYQLSKDGSTFLLSFYVENRKSWTLSKWTVDDTEVKAKIWVDAETKLIRKIEVVSQYKKDDAAFDKFTHTQVFGYYNQEGNVLTLPLGVEVKK